MEVIASLRGVGAVVERVDVTSRHGRGRADALLDVALGDVSARFAVDEKRRTPYPNELSRLDEVRDALVTTGEPLLVAPFVSETLAPALRGAGWSWADDHGNFDLRAPGLVLCQRRTRTAPRPMGKGLPHGTGSLAIVRALIRSRRGEDAGATALAGQAGVSQPRASQVLRQLHDLELVERSARGRWRPRREALIDRFLSDYGGPRGSQHYVYSLDAPTAVAVRVAESSTPTRRVVVSADVGPDLLVSWRRPSVVIVYATDELDLADLGLVEAQGRHDANVILRHPQDLSVFPIPAMVAEFQGAEILLADPVQQIWDLHDLGGADRLEAAGMLREWLLNRP